MAELYRLEPVSCTALRGPLRRLGVPLLALSNPARRHPGTFPSYGRNHCELDALCCCWLDHTQAAGARGLLVSFQRSLTPASMALTIASMRDLPAFILLCSIAMVTSCSSKREYHCYKNTGKNRTETSPHLRDETFCFDSKKSCEKYMDRETCFASGPIAWHCFPGDRDRKDEPQTVCYPTEAICDSSREARMAYWKGFENVDACTPQQSVYCVSGLTVCAATKEDCQVAATAVGATQTSQTCRRLGDRR